ncbi:MAG: hypothetical protein ABW215_09545 [Kibdelosporangium sp.]
MTTKARMWTIAGLLTGAAGLAIQKISGVAMPVVPPGSVFLVVAAALLANRNRRWAPIVAILAGAAEIAGFFASGNASRLTMVAEPGAFAGSWVRLAGVVVAVVAGAVAARVGYPRPVRV